MELTKDEEKSLNGEHGEALQIAYRILSATGEATDAEKLIPIHWAHVSGVNYNTIGDAGEEFLATLSKKAKFKVRTTVNPMGYDKDSVEKFGLDENFIQKQESIRASYKKMGVTPSFSCIPYEVYDMPQEGTQVAFAETNAAIYANSIGKLKTNKESAFSALASAITGKSPYSDLRKDDSPTMSIAMKVSEPNELTFGLLGYFAGKVADKSVAISGVNNLDKRCNKSLCASMGTSGTCGKFVLDDNSEFDRKVDDKLKKLFSKGDVVITSYTLPWLVDGGVKIWLDGSKENSAQRMTTRDNLSETNALEIVQKRYNENKIIYKTLYGFEFGENLSVFDKIIETDGLNAEQVLEIAKSTVREYF